MAETCKECMMRFAPYRDEETGKIVTCRQGCASWQAQEDEKMARYERARVNAAGKVGISPTHDKQYRAKQRRVKDGRVM